MNDGYIAIWFLTMGLILFMTGWHEQVADQLSRHALSLILMGALVLQAVKHTAKCGAVDQRKCCIYICHCGSFSIISATFSTCSVRVGLRCINGDDLALDQIYVHG